MRELATQTVTDHVARLFVEANTLLGEDVVSAFRSCLTSETSPTGRDVLSQLLESAELARKAFGGDLYEEGVANYRMEYKP